MEQLDKQTVEGSEDEVLDAICSSIPKELFSNLTLSQANRWADSLIVNSSEPQELTKRLATRSMHPFQAEK